MEQTSVNVDSPIAYASIISENDVPHQGCLSLDFTFTPGTERFAVVLQADQNLPEAIIFIWILSVKESNTKVLFVCMSRRMDIPV